MAGGSTRLSMLHAHGQRVLRAKRLRRDLNPEHVVALGASMAAARPELWPLLDPSLTDAALERDRPLTRARMAHFKIYGRDGASCAQHTRASRELVHGAAVRTLQLPADKRFQRFIAARRLAAGGARRSQRALPDHRGLHVQRAQPRRARRSCAR